MQICCTTGTIFRSETLYYKIGLRSEGKCYTYQFWQEMWCQKCKWGSEEVHGGNTPEIDILTTGCEMEVGMGEREAPLWNIPTEEYMFV